ncbi:MarR family transcriptional regulator [Ligilactobacillus agilis DSM 20509]|uniref:MarR family transcriptional regulator n=2 Tax=Ligilactobacillus agilis TaxID=1601 RepID=A0A0R2AAS6_9LACO|nr:MarR family transcriptional regulator [Ligilactobacillus agilis DSM 20509]
MWIEENELRKSKFNDLTMREMHAIHAISMYDHKSASEVAKELHLTPGTLTAMVDRLVRKGYVKRLRSEDDRRVIRLGLTKKGRVIYRAHEAFHNMMVRSFLKDLDATEIKTIEKALWNLEQFLREHS